MSEVVEETPAAGAGAAISAERTEILRSQRNDPSFAGIYEELEWRGLLSVSTDPEALAAALNGPEPITYYCGYDPTASSLHLGHLVQLLFMRRLQLAGHKPLGLVGGSTGLIGDPRPTAERTLNSRETVAEWVAALRTQIEKFLSFEGENAARMVNNLDWTAPLSAIDFLREIGKYFRVGTMIKKDAVAARLASDAGISYTEFSYQILQAIDFLELHRGYGCTLQSGGQDQWGNLVGGVELIRKATGNSVHAVGTPLITNSDGTKFGKSEGNAIWLDAGLCSPFAFYQFWLNQADADVISRLKVFTFLTRAEIEEYAEQVATEPHKRAAQKRLAFEVTALVHGTTAAQHAIDAAAALFGSGSYDSVPDEVLRQAVADLPAMQATSDTTVAQALAETGLVKSLSEARRTVQQGGVTLNGTKIADPEDAVAKYALERTLLVLGRGKKQKAAINFTA
ncbi:MAG: tyrosine--tRNA ligase [Microbacteriaceae bacterium]|nr:tyrosine--tRNA ligase [Microbacteriaceae bacterium]